jgi:hypothetical protein
LLVLTCTKKELRFLFCLISLLTAATRCPNVKNRGWIGGKGNVEVDSIDVVGAKIAKVAVPAGKLGVLVGVVVMLDDDVGVLVDSMDVGSRVDRVLTGICVTGRVVGSIFDSGTIATT